MAVQQVSVFVENRDGRLEGVTEVLANGKIDIQALCLADTTEYGVVRMLVKEPNRAKKLLTEAGFSARVTRVAAVKVPNQVGSLNKLLKILSSQKIGVGYMYTTIVDEMETMVIKLSDVDIGEKLLEEAGMHIITPQYAE